MLVHYLVNQVFELGEVWNAESRLQLEDFVDVLSRLDLTKDGEVFHHQLYGNLKGIQLEKKPRVSTNGIESTKWRILHVRLSLLFLHSLPLKV